MHRNASRSFTVSLIAFAVVGAALILTLPALFNPHQEFHAQLSGFLSGLALVLGITVLALRASRGTTGKHPTGR